MSDVDTWHKDRGSMLIFLGGTKGLEFAAIAIAGLDDSQLPPANFCSTPALPKAIESPAYRSSLGKRRS